MPGDTPEHRKPVLAWGMCIRRPNAAREGIVDANHIRVILQEDDRNV
jgi:hypothetical protein